MSFFDKSPLEQMLEGKHYTAKQMDGYYNKAINDATEVIKKLCTHYCSTSEDSETEFHIDKQKLIESLEQLKKK